jgi:hypothetical protein
MNSVSMWLGGTDRSKEGGWVWIDSTPFNYVNWAPGKNNVLFVYMLTKY